MGPLEVILIVNKNDFYIDYGSFKPSFASFKCVKHIEKMKPYIFLMR